MSTSPEHLRTLVIAYDLLSQAANDLANQLALAHRDKRGIELAVALQDGSRRVDDLWVAARRALVRHLRENGCSWQDVATVLGTTRQAAHEAFSRYERSDDK